MKLKRILTFFLSICLAFSFPPSRTLAAVEGTTGIGSYVVNLVSDPDTSTKPTVFCTSDANGYVWTDKTVAVNGADFDVTLSALAQEYKKVSTATSASTVAADVLLILDITSSMNNNDVDGTYRYVAMVAAANKAMQTILDANEKNRVMVYLFGNNNVQEVFLPLDHYTTTSTYGDSDLSGYSGVSKYIYYTTGSNPTFSLTVDSGTHNSSGSAGTSIHGNQGYSGNGTYTQLALANSISKLCSTIRSETYSIKRTPYVMLLTDGAATAATSSWYSVSTSNYSGLSGESTTSSTTVSAATILTARYQKDQLSAAYKTYNTTNGGDADAIFFSVGLGSAIAGYPYVSAIVNPSSAATGAPAVLTQIGTYAADGVSNGGTADYSSDYVYTTANADNSGYYAYTATSLSILDTAFSDLSNLVEAATQAVATPITTSSAASGTTASVVFTDVLGTNMQLKGAPSLAGVSGTAGTTVNGVTTYTFSGYASTASYNSTTRTLTWTLPADELPLIIFANRQTLTGSCSNASESPIRLTYTVELSSTSSLSGSYYSNAYNTANGAQATAVFTPATDNPYYYTVTADTNATDGYTSTAKTSFTSLIKTTNSTATAASASVFSMSNGTMTATLGNNGRLTPLATIAKSAASSTVVAGGTVSYTITVTNLTASALSDVVVTDAVPSGLTGITCTPSTETAVSGSNVTWTISSLAANSNTTLTVAATVPSDTAADTSFANTAKITTVGTSSLSTSAESSSVTVTSTNALTYSISANSPLDFGSLTLGYTQPSAQTVTMTNSGTGSITLTQPVSTSAYTVGTLSKTVLAAGETATFTIQPTAGLAVGTYNESITVSGTNSTSASVSVTFIVTQTAPTITDPTVAKTVTVVVGNTATLSITATDATAYQWYINRNDGNGLVLISGATASTYTTSATELQNSGYQYYCIASNTAGSVPSYIFTLNVIEGAEVPQTGDSNRPMLWFGIALFTAAGLAASVVLSRKKRCISR